MLVGPVVAFANRDPVLPAPRSRLPGGLPGRSAMTPSTSFDLAYAAALALGFTAAWRAWQTRKLRVSLPSPGAGPDRRGPASGRTALR